MLPIFTAAASAARRRQDDRGPRPRTSLLRLVVEEVVWAIREAYHPVKYAVAGAVSLGVGVLLGPRTPGPVLGGGWLLAVAVLVGLVGLNVVSALLARRREASEDDLVYVLRMAVAAVGLVLVATLLIALLLAVVTGAEVGPTSGGGGDSLDASLGIDRVLLLGAVLLVVATVATGVSDRVPLPTSLVLLAVGMLLGDDGLDVVSLDDPALVQQLAIVALVVILFDGGLGTSARAARLGFGPGLALATVGVAITTGVVALGAVALLDVEPRTAWLLGATIAATDAAAVINLLRRTPITPRLSAVLQVESGVNDPVAVLFTVGLLASWSVEPTAGAWVVFGAFQMIGGTVVGVGVGWAGARALQRLRMGTPELYPVLAIGIAGVAYGVATAVGASGLLATFLAGLVIGNDVPRRRTAVRAFTQSLAGGAEVGLFLVLGLLVFPSRLLDVEVVSIGIAVLLVFVARPVAAAATLAWFPFSWRETVAVSWLGLRGAVPIVLATLAFSADLAIADTVLDVVFFVVLLSLLVQGSTAGILVRRLGLEPDTAVVPDVLRQVTPLVDAGMDVVELELVADSALVGRRLHAVEAPDDVLVVTVSRDGATLVPKGQTRLRAGDLLVCVTTDTDEGARRLEDWVRTQRGVARPGR